MTVSPTPHVTTSTTTVSPSNLREFKLIENLCIKEKEINSLRAKNLLECLEKCQQNEKCTSASYNPLLTFYNCFLYNQSTETTIRSNWTSLIQIKQETTIISTVEYTSFSETYSANVMASSVCYDLFNNKSLNKIVFTLDKYLYNTNGWSIFTMSKLAQFDSSWQLNTIQNLFLFGTCSFGTTDRNIKLQSFILFYSPEGNCYENKPLEKQLITNENNLMSKKKKEEYKSIINLLSNELFEGSFFEFKNIKIHRSSNIDDSELMNFLIENIKKVINSDDRCLFLAEQIRKKIGSFWNVLVNQIDQVDQISVVSKSNTYLRVHLNQFDVILFHTSYTKCLNLNLEIELDN